jgi:hypothetical protein
VEPVIYSDTVALEKAIGEQSEGMKAKIRTYRQILVIKGHSIALPYADKIGGYNNLFELRPHFHNIEFRMIWFWKGNHAQFVHTFIEKGKKTENRRDYQKADDIKNIILGRR